MKKDEKPKSYTVFFLNEKKRSRFRKVAAPSIADARKEVEKMGLGSIEITGIIELI